jgi:hypothetical protein
MDPTENLRALHTEEEEIRAASLAAIEQHPELRDHWAIVAEAMGVIYAFVNEHQHQSDDELTLQLLGIRLFNAAGASIKLALSGYHQKAFDQVRDILETGFLLDYLATFPQKIAVWKASAKRRAISISAPALSVPSSTRATVIRARRARRSTVCFRIAHRIRPIAGLCS